MSLDSYFAYPPRPGRSIPSSLYDRLTTAGDKVYRVTSGATRAQAIAAAEAILKDHGVKAEIVRTSPAWKPGDVVVVFYGPARSPYTYVRGKSDWLVEKGREPKTDDFMTAQLDAGRLKAVLQAGGEAFDRSRL